MDATFDMSDKHAWDDSLLIDSWDGAVAEYKKYHSIHKSGKRLEDVLTQDELRELREDYDDVMEEPETTSTGNNKKANVDGPAVDGVSHAASNGVLHVVEAKTEPEELNNPQQQEQQAGLKETEAPMSQELPPAMSVPHGLLGSVQDENLKNIMMSWYYAGYYTGLHAGQQKQAQDASVTK